MCVIRVCMIVFVMRVSDKCVCVCVIRVCVCVCHEVD